MSDFVPTIDILGDAVLTDSIIDRSITEFLDQLATSIGVNAFISCSALTSVSLPAATSIGNSAFSGCSKLTSISLPAATSIGSSAFSYCSKLEALILSNADAVCTLSSNNEFISTPIASGTGYIYVPSALVDSYKAATKWSTYANQIRAIEDYPEICGTIT